MQHPRFRSSLHALRALACGVVLTLLAGVASAQPQAARATLQQAQGQHQIADMQFQIGRAQANAGLGAYAQSSFLQAQLAAQMLGMYAAHLAQLNTSSLQNGLYANQTALQNAIQCNQLLQTQAQVLQVHLQLLVQQPLSQQRIVAVQAQLIQTTLRLQQCAQYQAQAGG